MARWCCEPTPQASSTPTVPKRLALITLGCLQNLLAGGLVFGWAGIAGSMLLAPLDDGGAGLTHDQTIRIFAAASSVSFASNLALGIVLDRAGPRACSVASNCLVCVGCAAFALAQDMSHFFVATMVYSFGGPGIGVGLVHLGNLFPRQKNLVVSIVTGTITFSFAVFPAMDMLWQSHGFGYRSLFGGYAFLVLLSTVLALLIWPDRPFEAEDTNREAEMKRPIHLTEQPLNSFLRSNPHHQLDRSKSFFFSKKAIESGDADAIANMSPKDLPFWTQLTSDSYFRMSLLFVITSFFANFYVATLATELGDKQDFSISEQRQLTRIFTFISALGIVGSLVVGVFLDAFGFVATAVVTLLLGMVHVLPDMYSEGSFGWMVAGFISYSLFRSFIFPYLFAILSEKMGFKYFGVLSGLCFAASGVLQLSIAPLALWASGTCHVATDLSTILDCDQGRWKEVHYIQVVTLGILLIIPLWERYVEKSRRRALKDLLGVGTPFGSPIGTPRTQGKVQTPLLKRDKEALYGATEDEGQGQEVELLRI